MSDHTSTDWSIHNGQPTPPIRSSVVPPPLPLSRSTGMAHRLGRHSGKLTLTLAWADRLERQTVIALAVRDGRQTMNLRTMPGARLVVLHRPNGGIAGWAGMDADTDPARPELFSQFVYPAYRGNGLGALLEHVWWSYLASRNCATGYMRMELESNDSLFQHRLRSGYYRQMSHRELGRRFVDACRKCELFGNACARQIYLGVDVRRALAASTQAMGTLNIDALPLNIETEGRGGRLKRVSHPAHAK